MPASVCLAGEIETAGGCARFVQLALGSAHSCALAESGTVWCWGQNALGELGDSTRTSRWQPALVLGIADAVEIAASRDTTCARTRAGSVFCWGSNQYGQAQPTSAVQAPVPSPRAAVWCGPSEPPNLEPTSVLTRPSEVPGVVDAVALTVAARHSCALTRNGAVSCWGDNSRAQLDSRQPPLAFQRADVEGLPKAVALSAAGTQTCAVAEDKSVWCWGGCNEVGQLGTADKSPRLRRVPGVAGAEALESDPFRVCARLPGGLTCWGDRAACFTGVVAGAPAFLEFPSSIQRLVRATEDCASCELTDRAQVRCTFMRDHGVAATQTMLQGVRALAAGDEHFCAILNSGQIACWGPRSDNGQLGRQPSEGDSEPPKLVQWKGTD